MNGSCPHCGVSAGTETRHEMFTEEGEQQLSGLGAHEFLFHILHCPDCRELAMAKLGDWLGFSKWRPPPRFIDPDARAMAEDLFGDLMRLSIEDRSRVVENSPLYREPALIDLILENGIESGSMNDTRAADELAWMAVELTSDVEAQEAWRHSRMAQAFCLAGAARRLAGDLKEAETAFDDAVLFLSGGFERATYCRELALLRWDRGRLEEAAALLDRAAQVFGGGRQRQEEAACLALLGLLYVEQGLLDSALGPLLRAQPFMAFEHSWIAARVELSLGVCLAAHGRLDEAWGAAGAACLFGDSAEPVHQWLAAKLGSYAGDLEEARGELDSARRKLLAERRWVEAGLVSLDLAANEAEAKRDPGIESLMTDLAQAGGEAAARVVAQFDELIAPPKARAALLGSQLLLSTRYRNLGAPPIPWAWMNSPKPGRE